MSAIGNPRTRWGVLTILLFVLVPQVQAQPVRPSIQDIPGADQSADDFYGAIDFTGAGVTAQWLAPATVSRDDEFVLTLIVRGAANPHELKRPDLRTLETLTRQFHLLDASDFNDPMAEPTAPEVRFSYRLRPRASGPATIPPLTYRYYRLRALPRDRFQTTRADSIRLSVAASKSLPATPQTVLPLTVPDEYRHWATDAERNSIWTGPWWLPILAIPVLLGLWVGLWRWRYPDAARQAKLRRHRATRRALAQLQAALREPDSAGRAALALREYLITRQGLPISAQTPHEVALGLQTLGHEPARADRICQFLEACDAARFQPNPVARRDLVREAEILVTTWEEATP